ncbi:hypothetical protein [Streptomyces sp. NPDC050738]|uniref:hypothetical protein n=1 Tax=Streptomyces sp. NPDC050738 TaxID=3154744 RepID=UPI0034191DAD
MFDGGVRRRLVFGLAVLTATGALELLAPPQGAHAASGCPGQRVKSVAFATGHLDVYRSGSYSCAVAVAKSPGAKRPMSVSLQARGSRAVVDSGRFAQYAGPVKVRDGARCVRAVGTVSGKSGTTGWILC